MAFEPPEEKGASGEAPHVVGAHHDDGKFSDRVRDARFETQEIRFVGPVGPAPPEVAEDADERRSAIDRELDLFAEKFEERIGRPRSGGEMQPALSSQSRGIEPGAVARGLDSVVGAFVAEEHAGFALRRAGGDEADRGPELLLGFPEVRKMVSGGGERTVEAEPDPVITTCPAMESVLMEERHEPLLLQADRASGGIVLVIIVILEASERPDHGLPLRDEETAPLASAEVGIKPVPFDRIELALQARRDRIRQLGAAHLSRRRRRHFSRK